MKKLQIKMTNCYGIGELIHDFDFSKTNAILVYAPNGSMKTSFANSFSDYANNDSPKDLAWPERISKFECIDEKGVKIQSKSIFVVNPENREYDASPYVTSFLASQELKKRYDSIYNELETRKKDFIKDLKSISQSTDCEEEFINIFGTKEKSNFFQIIEAIFDEIISIEKMESFDFKYNDVFDKKNKVKEFLKEQSSLLNEYFSLYLNLLNQSSFFHKSESNSFGTYQANNILNTTNDNAFFEAGHKFVLSDKRTVSSYDKFKELITTEIDKIINDSKLKNTFEKIDKKLGGNQELRLFKNVIEKNNSLLPRLVDYEGFRRVVFLSYLVQLKDKTKQLIGLYNAKRKELEEIVYRANQESSKWHKILETYRNRFSVPFKVSIENQTDVILKQDTAHLVFEFEEKNNKIEQSKENLLRILSKGEQRAFFILQFIFEIEARKENAQDSLLIFDDISDSFDYKNKYAIIEYIKDFQDIDYFKSIILTHNFDFYRTIHSRLNKMQVLMAEKNEETRTVMLRPVKLKGRPA